MWLLFFVFVSTKNIAVVEYITENTGFKEGTPYFLPWFYDWFFSPDSVELWPFFVKKEKYNPTCNLEKNTYVWVNQNVCLCC